MCRHVPIEMVCDMFERFVLRETLFFEHFAAGQIS